jgi:hypothetical protein
MLSLLNLLIKQMAMILDGVLLIDQNLNFKQKIKRQSYQLT